MKIKKSDYKKIIADIGFIVLGIFLFWTMMLFKQWYLIWICFFPLFYVIKKNNFLNSIIYSFVFVVFLNFTSFLWFIKEGWNIFFISIFLMWLLLILFSFFVKLFSSNKLKSIISFPFFWTAMLFLFSFLFPKFGNLWFNFAFFQPELAFFIFYIKPAGLTFLIMLCNSLIANYIYYKDKKIIYFAIALLILVFGLNYIYVDNDNYQKEIKFALIQGNFNETWAWRSNNYEQVFQTYEKLSLDAGEKNPDFIIWPEYSIVHDIFENESLMKRIGSIANRTNSYLIIGGFSLEKSADGSYSGDRADTAFIFSPEGKLINTYNSVKPYPLDLSILPGNNSFVINTEKGNFIIIMCYEEFVYDLNDEIYKNADFIVSMTNNQVFDRTFGIELISLFTRLKASEKGKPLVRVTNTGISQVIDKNGKIIAKLEPYKKDYLIGEIKF